MASVQLDIPESALAAVHWGPEQFSAEMRLAAAAAWYGQGRISQHVAAEIAGLSREDFLVALARMEQPSSRDDRDHPASPPDKTAPRKQPGPIDPGQFFGVMNLSEDPLEFQNRIRGEWE
jgi:hypothetical protein